MAKYESSVKQISYPVDSVYAKVSDLNNLSVIQDTINNPMLQEQIPSDKFEQVRDTIDNIKFTSDTVSINAGMMGSVVVKVVEREENRCVKFESVSSPVNFKFWVQMLPVSETTSKMKLTLDADLNFFMKQMFDKHLREGIEKFADMLARIPYN
ncbi:MAG: SRPBCC family protein [Bacteroidaceae bacterium]|nr:SRPBCC family protein [Bacteroidaceae bacterium]